jgi:hypothetical protein
LVAAVRGEREGLSPLLRLGLIKSIQPDDLIRGVPAW